MKFRIDVTKGGHKILSLHGPDECEEYAGVVDTGGSYLTIMWYDTGSPVSANKLYSLIPLADEPEPSEMTELWNEIEALREIVADTLKRMNEMRADYIEHINGLRNDYLADKEATSPARVDNLEERIEILEANSKQDALAWYELKKQFSNLEEQVKDANETAAFANQKTVAWTDRLEALEQRSQPKGVCVTRKSMSIEERAAYGKAVALVERHGMVVVTEEHMQKLLTVIEAAKEVVRDPYPDEVEHLAGTLKALEEQTPGRL